MDDAIPKGKLKRTLSSGKILTRLGTNQLGYYLKKPFLSGKRKADLQKEKDVENAKIVFNGLSLLRGTALKAAQMLSFESDVIPQELRKELEKSYNQVPPINRALARKIITNNLEAAPEEVFKKFESTAFAAASLGQVHHATTYDNEQLAVKIQYPDIAATISNDIRMLKGILRPMSQYEVIKTALNEIETVLLNETDYEKEAGNINFFKKNLNHDQVRVPQVYEQYTTGQVLAMSHMDGIILNRWLETAPDQDAKNRVAQTLHDIFVRGFYELKTIHADPNPGNFLVTNDNRICLLDFGCVRTFDDGFVALYQELIRTSPARDKDACRDLLQRIRLITPDLAPDIKDRLVDLFMDMGDWFSRLFWNRHLTLAPILILWSRAGRLGKICISFENISTVLPRNLFFSTEPGTG